MQLNITELEAQALSHMSTENFVAMQLDRFEHVHSDDDPTSEAYEGGSLCWCATAADALLLISFERNAGHSAMLLWDLAYAQSEEWDSCYVVLTSRSFDPNFHEARRAAREILKGIGGKKGGT